MPSMDNEKGRELVDDFIEECAKSKNPIAKWLSDIFKEGKHTLEGYKGGMTMWVKETIASWPKGMTVDTRRIDGAFTTEYMKLVVDALRAEGHEVLYLTPKPEAGPGLVLRVGQDANTSELTEDMLIHVLKDRMELGFKFDEGPKTWEIYRDQPAPEEKPMKFT